MSRNITPERGAYSSQRVEMFASAVLDKLYGQRPDPVTRKKVIDVQPIRARESATGPKSAISRMASRLRSLLPRF